MTASAALDGRIDWSGTAAALIAAYPSPAFPHGTWAPTNDKGVYYWDAVSGSGQSMGPPGNYGPGFTPFYRWKPVGQNVPLVFTAVIAAAATTATLNASWG